jgi:hypothetical protein
MSERKKALTFLRIKQRHLAAVRRLSVRRDEVEYCENEVLAALSWLWDAQERALDVIDDEWRKSIARRIKAGPKIYFRQ